MKDIPESSREVSGVDILAGFAGIGAAINGFGAAAFGVTALATVLGVSTLGVPNFVGGKIRRFGGLIGVSTRF